VSAFHSRFARDIDCFSIFDVGQFAPSFNSIIKTNSVSALQK
jgi:hypothetical protein